MQLVCLPELSVRLVGLPFGRKELHLVLLSQYLPLAPRLADPNSPEALLSGSSGPEQRCCGLHDHVWVPGDVLQPLVSGMPRPPQVA